MNENGNKYTDNTHTRTQRERVHSIKTLLWFLHSVTSMFKINACVLSHCVLSPFHSYIHLCTHTISHRMCVCHTRIHSVRCENMVTKAIQFDKSPVCMHAMMKIQFISLALSWLHVFSVWNQQPTKQFHKNAVNRCENAGWQIKRNNSGFTFWGRNARNGNRTSNYRMGTLNICRHMFIASNEASTCTPCVQ